MFETFFVAIISFIWNILNVYQLRSQLSYQRPPRKKISVGFSLIPRFENRYRRLRPFNWDVLVTLVISIKLVPDKGSGNSPFHILSYSAHPYLGVGQNTHTPTVSLPVVWGDWKGVQMAACLQRGTTPASCVTSIVSAEVTAGCRPKPLNSKLFIDCKLQINTHCTEQNTYLKTWFLSQ